MAGNAAEPTIPEKTVRIKGPLPYLVEKELIENQNRYFRVHGKFVVTKIISPLQDKFYSKYCDTADLYEKYQEFVERVVKKCKDQPQFPIRESQVYGWIPANISSRDILQMNFISAPKLRCNMTVYGEKLISERITERNSFNGLRFFLR